MTTNADGTYRLTVSAASLPCLLEAVLADGTELHSVAQGTGTSVTANITPFTELVVANLAGGNTSTYYDNFSTTTAATITTTTVSTAQSAVAPVLASAGVDTAAVGNVVTGTVGTAYTAGLGALNTALTTSGVTLVSLSTSTGQGSSNNAAVTNSVSLPPELLLKPQASNCAALRSGTYRVVQLMPSDTTGATDPVTATGTVAIDAATLTLTQAGDPPTVFAPNGTCRYTADAGATDIVVSQAGVLVVRSSETVSGVAANYLFIAFPEQAIALSELAGTWNTMGWEITGGPTFGVKAATIVFDSSGAATSGKCFDQTLATAEAACTTQTSLLPKATVNAAGGFDWTGANPADPWKSRLFGYRTGSGNLMLVDITPNGSFTLATKQRTLSLPTVGDVTVFWNFDVNVNGQSANGINTSTNTVLALDTAAQSYIRNNVNVSSTGTTTATQTLAINSGRNGYTHRLASTGVREFYSLGLRGTGLSTPNLPNNSTGASSNALYSISVQQP